MHKENNFRRVFSANTTWPKIEPAKITKRGGPGLTPFCYFKPYPKKHFYAV
jgi:hypothetical protein